MKGAFLPWPSLQGMVHDRHSQCECLHWILEWTVTGMCLAREEQYDVNTPLLSIPTATWIRRVSSDSSFKSLRWISTAICRTFSRRFNFTMWEKTWRIIAHTESKRAIWPDIFFIIVYRSCDLNSCRVNLVRCDIKMVYITTDTEPDVETHVAMWTRLAASVLCTISLSRFQAVNYRTLQVSEKRCHIIL